MESSMEIPQKIKDRTTIWSSNSTVGICLKEMKRYLDEWFLFLANLFFLQVEKSATSDGWKQNFHRTK